MANPKTFRIVLIKPSRYDDQGYLIQWFRNFVPSNTLAVLHSLARDCAKRMVLGKDVQIIVDVFDEGMTVIPVNILIRKIKKGGGGMIGLVGVQTNQFPRSVDLAVPFIKAELPVVIGGFHVSGSLAMLPKIPMEIQSALDKGITIFAGEAENHLEELLCDAYKNRLKPMYNFLQDLPELEGMPMPYLPFDVIRSNFVKYSSFDAGRGCPFQCSFCTIINVQGRQSRRRSPDDIEALVRANYQQGIRRYFITDDDFARNKDWEPILDRLIKLREKEHFRFSFTIQVDTLCHKIPHFIEKAARAGCRNVFIGLESVNPDALLSVKKRQNKIGEYRKMLQSWKNHDCLTYTGYILGFPTDTPQSIVRDIETIKRELPVDLALFNILTPLPGSEDHKKLSLQGVWMDPDFNKYDGVHVTTVHPLMSAEELQRAYNMAWRQFYGLEHAETVLRRLATKGRRLNKTRAWLMWHYFWSTVEGIHPHEAGLFRRKSRTLRQSGFLLENPLLFYPRRLWEIVFSTIQLGILYWQYLKIQKRVERDPMRGEYTDSALIPFREDEEQDLDFMDLGTDLVQVSTFDRRQTGVVN